jgi:hypothetical protein
MSAKKLDAKNRWRSKTVSFRMSPEEAEELNTKVKLSGLTKQEYLINCLLKQEIVVVGNPKVYISLKQEMEEIATELKSIKSEIISEELLNKIELIFIIMNGLSKEND